MDVILRCPLVSHRLGDTGQGSRTLFPAVRVGSGMVNAGRSAIYDVGGTEPGQTLEPRTGGLDFAVAELPGLDDLGVVFSHDLDGVSVQYGILTGLPGHRGVEEGFEESGGINH